MACGVALKRPLELDGNWSPEGVKRPRTTTAHCSPLRPTFSFTNNHSNQSFSATSPSPSIFTRVSTRLTPQQLESYLRAEIRCLKRRRLLPRHGEESESTAAYRVPRSPNNSSDSEGELPSSSAGSSRHLRTSSSGSLHSPQFSFKQVQMICERLLKEQEERLREEYEGLLNAKLTEQYDTFVRFTQDQIHRHIESAPPSYLS